MRLCRIQARAWAWFAIACGGLLHAQVTTRDDAVGKLLNQWHAAGTAAGLSAITYENRDGGHSTLDPKEWPQLKIHAAEGEDKGPAHVVRDMPLIGNSSMASGVLELGSLPRLYMLQQQGFDFLAGQYVGNNHFTYPEHEDYDAGWNGRGGWGDLYPANLPCLTISRGSSYKDQVFVRAFLGTLAAFPPETQKLLLERRLLAPTLQAILRRCYKRCVTPEDYFTGKAHPVVFDGSLVDEEKMVRLAHETKPDAIPPLVRLDVIAETMPVPGKHFFESDLIKDEKLGASPYAISRIFRGSAFIHEMLVTAKRSADTEGRPLTFKWTLLQGDLSRIRIEPTADGASAKIAVAWHPEMRGADGVQTRRVDIGVFAHNGVSWSAPSIITFYMLPNEARFYGANQRLEEICYDAMNPDPGIPGSTDLRWMALGYRVGQDQKHAGIALLTHHMSEIAIVRLQGLVEKLGPDQDAWRQISTDPAKKEQADKAFAALQEKLRAGLEESFDTSGKTLVRAYEDGVRSVAAVADLYLAGQDVIPSLVKTSGKPDAMQIFAAARQRLVDYKIIRQDAPGRYASVTSFNRLTAAEKYHLSQFHLTVLNLALLPEFLDRAEEPAYVDTRLTTIKPWRDIYRYTPDGKPDGWTRVMNGRTFEFDAEGRLLSQGPGGPVTELRYLRDTKSGRLVFMPK